MILLYFRK